MMTPRNFMENTQTDEEFRQEMIQYIKKHWAGVLGSDIHLLDLPNGLDLIAEKYAFDAQKTLKKAV
jgi:hypothetical protein